MRAFIPIFATVAAAVVAIPSTADAVPAFARKYKTSCVTCHTVFPRLTPFGQAFRMAGYRFPAGEDEDMVKDEPVELGVDAYRDLFPQAVWPATISHLSPLSVVVKSQVTAWGRGETVADLAGLEPTFDLYVATAIGERLSVFGKVQANGPSCVNCHSYFSATVNDVWKHSTIKVGKFQPEYFSFHQQPFVEFHDVLGPERTVGNNAWSLGKDYGVEVSGVVFGRGRYVAGVLEGRGNLPSSAKDMYAHLAWKLGGASLDGESDPTYKAPTKNWRERSLTVGALVYNGSAKVASNDEVGAAVTVRDHFVAGALDANLIFDDLNVFGAALFEVHSAPNGTDTDVVAERYLAGVRYTHWPWLVPEVLFDYFNSQLRGDFTYQLRGRVEALVRANLKVRVDAAAARPVGEARNFQSVVVGFDVGF